MVLGKGGLYPKHHHSRTVQRAQQKHLSVQEGPGRVGTWRCHQLDKLNGEVCSFLLLTTLLSRKDPLH